MKLEDEDKKIIKDLVTEGLSWIDSNQLASKEEFKEKYDEANKTSMPIMTKFYQSGGAPPPGGGSGGMPDMSEFMSNMGKTPNGPIVDEVD